MKVVISEDLWSEIPVWFREKYEVVYEPDLFTQPTVLAKQLNNAEALIVRNRTQVTHELLRTSPFLQVVGRLGVGLDNIDLSACHDRNVSVITARGFNAIAVAEYVFAAMLWKSRFLHVCDASIKSGKWDRMAGTGWNLYGKTLGLIGMGDIGHRVAIRAKAFGMNVIAYDPAILVSNVVVQDLGVQLTPLTDLLGLSDFISIHVPLLPNTRKMIGARELAMMKSDVMLINTSRGGIVDEGELYHCLLDCPSKTAVLDVRESEPPTDGDVLLELSNVLLTPHVAGVTHESSEHIAAFVLENVNRILQGKSAQGIVE